VSTATGKGELTLICDKFWVFSALLSLDYDGFVSTLPGSSVASGMAMALRFAVDAAADWREDRRKAWSTVDLCGGS
jgi:hypothetical protein